MALLNGIAYCLIPLNDKLLSAIVTVLFPAVVHLSMVCMPHLVYLEQSLEKGFAVGYLVAGLSQST